MASWIYAQYNQNLKLVRDSPITASTTYWLLSANLWSSVALRYYYPEVSRRIYFQLLKWGYTRNNLHEAVVGYNIPFPIRSNRTIVVYNTTDYTIKIDMFDGPDIYNHTIYFDHLIYLALSEHWKGNASSATDLFNAGSRMWNGMGIIDEFTRVSGLYATYKLALLLYASRILEITLPNKERVE